MMIAYLSVSQEIDLLNKVISFNRCDYLYIHSSIYPYIYASIYLCIYLSIHLPFHFPYLSIYLSIYPSTYLFIYLSIDLPPTTCSEEYDDKEEAGLRAMEYGDPDIEAPSNKAEVRRKVSKLSSLSGAGNHVYTEFSNNNNR